MYKNKGYILKEIQDNKITEYKVYTLNDALILATNIIRTNQMRVEPTFSIFELDGYEDGRNFNEILDSIDITYNIVKNSDLENMISYDKSIVVGSNQKSKSFTGEYIKNWCKHHMNLAGSEYQNLAYHIYVNHWTDYAENGIPIPTSKYKVKEIKDTKHKDRAKIKLIRVI